jgi:hypothetical protein
MLRVRTSRPRHLSRGDSGRRPIVLSEGGPAHGHSAKSLPEEQTRRQPLFRRTREIAKKGGDV